MSVFIATRWNINTESYQKFTQSYYQEVRAHIFDVHEDIKKISIGDVLTADLNGIHLATQNDRVFLLIISMMVVAKDEFEKIMVLDAEKA